jgi:heme A synthase
MSATNLLSYYGTPTLFILLCMGTVGWVSSKRDDRSVRKPFKWVTGWGLVGAFVAILLALTASSMNTDFVYNHASLIWPFCLSLAALNDRPPMGAIIWVVSLMGVVNGLYYALLASLTWKIIQAIPKRSPHE